MFKALGEVNGDLEKAQEDARKLDYAGAVAALDQALDAAGKIRDDRNQALHDVTDTWYKTWFPRVREAHGRHVGRAAQSFVDTAPSEAAHRRQEGLAYLIERELALPLGDWVNQVRDVRNRFAVAHKLPTREVKFDWQDTTTLQSEPTNREL
jgi:hypothetical protein